VLGYNCLYIYTLWGLKPQTGRKRSIFSILVSVITNRKNTLDLN